MFERIKNFFRGIKGNKDSDNSEKPNFKKGAAAQDSCEVNDENLGNVAGGQQMPTDRKSIK